MQRLFKRGRAVNGTTMGVVLLCIAVAVTGTPVGAQPTIPDLVTEISDTISIVKTDQTPSNADIALGLVAETPLPGASTVVVSRDDTFADALASGVLQSGAPLLLVPSAGPLPDGVKRTITTLAPTRAIVLGGISAVSDAVTAELATLGMQVERREGASRFETAVAIAERDAVGSQTVILARAFQSEGSNDPTQAFADALAAGGLSARNGWPILLTQTDVLSGPTRDYLMRSGATHVLAIGGTAAISEGVLTEAVAIVGSGERIAGPSRAGTAISIAKEGGAEDASDVARVVLVDSADEDAWAGGFAAAAHAAAFDAPVLLTSGATVPPETRAFLSTGITGSGSQPVMTCVTVPTVCEASRQAAGLAAAIPITISPGPGTRLASGSMLTVTTQPPAAQLAVSGTCLDGTVVIASGEQVQVSDPIPAGSCNVIVSANLADGATQTSTARYNDAASLDGGDRTLVGPLDVSITQPGGQFTTSFTGRRDEAMVLALADVTPAPGTTSTCVEAEVLTPTGTQVMYANDCPTAGGTVSSGAPAALPVDGSYTVNVRFLEGGRGSATLYVTGEISSTIIPDGDRIVVSFDRPGDAARLEFAGVQGQRISFSLADVSGTGGRSACATVTLVDPSGGQLESVHSCGEPAGTYDTIALTRDGTYHLSVTMDGGTLGSAAVYLNAPSVGAITPGGPPVQVNVVRPGDSAELVFQGTAGQQVSLGLDQFTPQAGQSGSCVTLELRDRFGTSLDQLYACPIPGGRAGSSTLATLATSGSHTLSIRFDSGAAGGMQVYLNTPTAGTIAPDGPAATINGGQPGAFTRLSFAGTAGQEVSMAIGAMMPGAGQQSACVEASLIGPFGSSIASVSSCGAQYGTTNGLIRLASSGTHVVEVHLSDGASGSGMLYLNSPDTGTITVDADPTPVTLARPGDVAVLSVAGAADQTVVLTQTQTSSTAGSCSQTDLTDTAGSYLDGLYTCLSNGQSESTGGVVLAAAGSYRIVHSYDNGGGQSSLSLTTQ